MRKIADHFSALLVAFTIMALPLTSLVGLASVSFVQAVELKSLSAYTNTITGADPTGVADSTTALQVYINANTDIYIPPGIYAVCNLSLQTNAGQFLHGTHISKFISTAGCDQPTIGTTCTGNNPIAVSDIVIDGNGDNQTQGGSVPAHGLYFVNCPGAKVHHVAFMNNAGHALYFNNPTSPTSPETYGQQEVSDVTFRNCGNATQGIYGSCFTFVNAFGAKVVNAHCNGTSKVCYRIGGTILLSNATCTNYGNACVYPLASGSSDISVNNVRASGGKIYLSNTITGTTNGTTTISGLSTNVITAGWQTGMEITDAGGDLISTQTYGAITGGSTYTNGTYNNVALTGGTGNGATANIVVSGNAVTSVTPVSPGLNYVVGDVLSASSSSIGSTGSGFSVPVATIPTVIAGVANGGLSITLNQAATGSHGGNTFTVANKYEQPLIDGFRCTGSTGFKVTNSTSNNNPGNGISLLNGCNNAIIVGNVIRDNGQTTSPVPSIGGLSGIKVYDNGTPTINFLISGNQLYDDQGGSATQVYGLEIANASDFGSADLNFFNGNKTGNLGITNTQNNVRIGNGNVGLAIPYEDPQDVSSSNTSGQLIGSVPVPGYEMGRRGIYRLTASGTFTNVGGGTKTLKARNGSSGNDITLCTSAAASADSWSVEITYYATSTAGYRAKFQCLIGAIPTVGTSSGGFGNASQDMTTQQTIGLIGQVSSASDTITKKTLAIDRLR